VATWLQGHLHQSYAPLLSVSWILDIDATIKPIYGHQQGAEIGYNPHKPGRPSHVYHSYLMGTARLALDVEVQPGIQTAAHHALPGLWRLVDSLRLPELAEIGLSSHGTAASGDVRKF
jgi:hypothetical protein